MLKQLDYLGFVLSAAAWVMFTLVFTSGGSVWPWSNGRTIASLVVLGVLVLSYMLQQYFCIFTSPSTRSFPGHYYALVHKCSSLSQRLLLSPVSMFPFTTSLYFSSLWSQTRHWAPPFAFYLCSCHCRSQPRQWFSSFKGRILPTDLYYIWCIGHTRRFPLLRLSPTNVVCWSALWN
jgi:hypothetical protein